MGLETILAVWGGMYLNREVIAEAELQPYIDDALNELEFLLVGCFLQSQFFSYSVNVLAKGTVNFDVWLPTRITWVHGAFHDQVCRNRQRRLLERWYRFLRP
jgi:hypothetical protein